MGLFDRLRKIVWLLAQASPPAQSDPLAEGAVHRQRGNALLGQGRFDEAAASYRDAVAANPKDADAFLNLGFAFSEQLQYAQAEQAIKQSLGINPAQADAFYILGVMAKAQDNAAGAIDNFFRTIDLKPDFEIVYSELCQLLYRDGQVERAKEVVKKGISVFPEAADFHAYLGNLYAAEGNAHQAIVCLRKVVSIRPDHADVHTSLGNVLRKSNRLDEALASYEQAVLLRPGSADALNDRGVALGSLGRHEEALASLQQALDLQPGHVHALANLCAMLASLRRYPDASRAMARLMEIDPGYPYAIGNLLNWQMYSCDWSEYPANLARVQREAIAGNKAARPFGLLAVSACPAALLQSARVNTADSYPPSAAPLWTGQRYQHDKIRVAYLSADLRDHAMAYLMAELFELHDRERFETVAISFGPDSQGAMRQRLRRSFGRFVDVRTLGDREVAALLREMEVDIAVDLMGFTTNSRPGILANRPAPVQVNYLGFPGSMGADYIDYILADRHVLPFDEQEFYTEKVVWLPDSYQVNDSKRIVAERTPSRTACGLPPSAFVFCCFNNNYKVTPEVFDIWMRLLHGVAGSVLWLLEDNATASANLRAEAVKRGIAADRLVFAARMELDEHLARHRLADLFLDTLPYNAHTTASDALWAGLPLVTCLGHTFPGRVAASLLHAVGLPELVTESPEGYEALSLKLATSPALLSEIRAKLWRNRRECPLFDTRRSCAHIESAYTLMWERHQRGEVPASFAVPLQS